MGLSGPCWLRIQKSETLSSPSHGLIGPKGTIQVHIGTLLTEYKPLESRKLYEEDLIGSQWSMLVKDSEETDIIKSQPWVRWTYGDHTGPHW